MKRLRVSFWVALSAMLASCTPVNYFQMYKAVPDSEVTKTGNNLVYEDSQCKVSYNLWTNGGDAGFVFQNKTDQNIYLDLGESFFIINGVAHNYFRNRVFTTSSSSSVGKATGVAYAGAIAAQSGNVAATSAKATSRNAAVTASRGYSVSHAEERIVCIPPHAAKRIAEYSINNQLIRNCDLFRYPLVKQISTSKYTKANSPLVFSNQIVYRMGEKGEAAKLNHEFYVTEITNYPQKSFLGKRAEEFCGEKSLYQTDYFLYAAPENFYIEYSKSPNDNFKH